MKSQFWIGLIVGVILSAIVGIGLDRYQEFRFSNRKLVHLMHPLTGDRITLLVLGGISHDVTYLIRGYTQSLEVPNEKNAVELGDEIGITYTDSSWVVYYLGSFVDKRNMNEKNLSFVQLTPKSYNELIKNGYERFLYRGSF